MKFGPAYQCSFQITHFQFEVDDLLWVSLSLYQKIKKGNFQLLQVILFDSKNNHRLTFFKSSIVKYEFGNLSIFYRQRGR